MFAHNDEVSRFTESPQGLQDPLDLLGAFGALSAEMDGELFWGGGGVGG